jgi:DNA-binding NarL/FixJ family response regulator
MPDTSYRVLLVGQKDRVPRKLPRTLEETSGSEIVAEAASAVSEALKLITEKGYDAVVCWIERDSELAGVIRIRKTKPDLPIMVFTSQEDPEFSNRARQAGATRTAPPHGRSGLFPTTSAR